MYESTLLGQSLGPHHCRSQRTATLQDPRDKHGHRKTAGHAEDHMQKVTAVGHAEGHAGGHRKTAGHAEPQAQQDLQVKQSLQVRQTLQLWARLQASLAVHSRRVMPAKQVLTA